MLTIAFVVASVLGASCGDDSTSTETLPPIATTTTSTTVVVTTIAVQRFYVVRPGDNLSSIAKSFGVDQRDLMALNGITDPDHIEAGDELAIPPPKVIVDVLPGATTTTTG